MVQSVKETKEAGLGLILIAALIKKELGNGFQLSDIVAVGTKIASDSELQEKLKAALEGIGSVPAEIKDISVMEGLELATVWVPAVLEALKA